MALLADKVHEQECKWLFHTTNPTQVAVKQCAICHATAAYIDSCVK